MSDLKRKIVAEISARNKASGQIAKFRSDIDKTNRTLGRMAGTALAMAGVGGGLYALQRGLRSAVMAAAEQEKAENALHAAIGKNIGQYKNYAAAIQKQTIYGDEQILSQMAYAANLGVTSDKLKEATKAAVGLAARFRIDLASAMMLVGRASQGQTQLLTRYGIVIDQSLSDQDKFNELLRIGADSFYLAEEAAKDSAGTYQQFRNMMSDIAETIGGPLMKGLTDMAREVVKNKEGWQEFFRVQTEGWAEVLSGFENVRDVIKELQSMKEKEAIKPLSQQDYNMWIAGGPAAKPPAALPQGILDIPPARQQHLAQMRARLRRMDQIADMSKQWLDMPIGPAKIHVTPDAPISDARKRMMALQGQMAMERALIGRIGEPRQHARLWWRFQQEALKEYSGDMDKARAATESFRAELKQIEETEKLARIAESVGDAFADAFEKMAFEAGKARDVINALIKDIARSVMRNLVLQPMAMGISSAIGGIFGLTVPTEPTAAVPTAQHGGEVVKTGLAVIHKGERYSGVGNGGPGAPMNIIFEYKGQPLQQKGQARYSGRDVIVELETVMNDHIQRGEGPLRNTIINLGSGNL